MIFELSITVNGMAFLIIFKMIAKMKIANNENDKIDLSDNLFNQDMTHSMITLKESKLYGA